MEVLIVSKTHMANNACVGGLVLADNSYIRLLNPGNRNQPEDTDFEVGQVWDLDFIPRNPIQNPHVEDIIIQNRRFVRTRQNLSRLIRERGLIDWDGSINETFDGLLQWTNAGSGYINPEGELPNQSVGFWRTDADLERYEYFGKTRYRYSGNRSIKFVGFQDVEDTIETGSIIRLSLGRIYTANDITGYWLQLSGWY